ncbi:MAG: carboxypeptidase regulatory-like domain-containing protein, partial [Rhodothermales bacterium]
MLANRTSGTTANEAGMFTFSRLAPGNYIVIATHVGYQSAAANVNVPPGGETQAELALQADPIVVQPIVIDGLQWRLPSSDLGSESLAQADLIGNPGTGAEGVLGGLNALLGVRVSDATADIHVQGGETGEHQLTLDGAPVFLPLSFASFVGPFSPFAIGNITVHKAGFGASEGSQISGVVDVRHDVNFSEDRRLDLQVDPLSVNARVGFRTGRPGTRQAAFTAAGRMSLWDLYAPAPLDHMLSEWNTSDPFLFTLFDRSDSNPRFDDVDPTTGNPRIGFRDLHAAGRIRFDALKSLHASAYVGQTSLGTDRANPESGAFSSTPPVDGPDRYRDLFTWDTGIGQTRYEVVLGSRLLASFGLRGSYYRVRHDYSVPDSSSNVDALETADQNLERIDDGNRIYEVAAESRFDYALDDRNTLTVGTEII